MKTRFLAIAVASTAALGTFVLSAPAHAGGLEATSGAIGVTVTVPEVLYLRTVDTISAPISIFEITGFQSTGSRTDRDGVADGSNGVNLTSPFVQQGSQNFNFNKVIPNVFAVWSNNSTADASGNGISITVQPTANQTNLSLTNAAGTTVTNAATLNGVQASFGGQNNFSSVIKAVTPGLVTPAFGDIQLNVQLNQSANQGAGTYTGAAIDIIAASL
ncbi:hypothetical protein [Cylindrospermum sp. FACHB-282]|uniref:hypothetical protein n=1 Tax=Cylindrospermum sp. FACHB-282 TaxID=2692794 RepID=UPI0016865B27|nr:hypothetical protein [Cylindrospermum sp. FACHB-282]MBD2387968.1 hypothetical protein [Cylindrospermum sp. FACHB-282]